MARRVFAMEVERILQNTSRQILTKSRSLKPLFLRSRGDTVYYAVKSGKKQYEVVVKFLDPVTLDCQVKCNCDGWKFQGGEYHAKRNKYLLGNPRGTATKPVKRDPKGKNWVCKHIACVLRELSERQLSKMASRVASRYLKDR